MVRTRVNKGKCVDFLSKTKQFDWIKELFILNEQNFIPLLTMNEREIRTFLCKWEISVHNFEHFSFFFYVSYV